eukprot:2989508-Rhodomonas_salina.2
MEMMRPLGLKTPSHADTHASLRALACLLSPRLALSHTRERERALTEQHAHVERHDSVWPPISSVTAINGFSSPAPCSASAGAPVAGSGKSRVSHVIGWEFAQDNGMRDATAVRERDGPEVAPPLVGLVRDGW